MTAEYVVIKNYQPLLTLVNNMCSYIAVYKMIKGHLDFVLGSFAPIRNKDINGVT